jgi:DNA-directed RNA polymerase sigma subunit (sigma70/sigma32)
MKVLTVGFRFEARPLMSRRKKGRGFEATLREVCDIARMGRERLRQLEAEARKLGSEGADR